MRARRRNIFTDRDDQGAQIIRAKCANIQHAFFDLLPESLTDTVIEQRVFIREVGVERGSVHAGLLGNVLHRNGLESLCSHDIQKGLLEQLPGPFDTRVQFFFGEGRQHFGSSVAYPTDSRF